MNCPSGKRTYRTHRKAVVALDRVRNKRQRYAMPPIAAERTVYQCRDCGFWHLTHLEPDLKWNAA